MFERIKSLYLKGQLNDAGLKNAVSKGWITEEEFAEITKGSER
ncbi:MAG: XkdX family protein [Firmicutes bacterium]|nr:XkdX family protein [[Eubacterium] siraeum]MCM1488630.1 XkdX family protein [Bacillota bacterium]